MCGKIVDISIDVIDVTSTADLTCKIVDISIDVISTADLTCVGRLLILVLM